MLPLEDHKLLSAIQTGSEKAFDMLFRKYYPALCAYSHKMVSLEDAEECAQDTLLWLWENRESVIIQSSLSHYLFAAVYHRSLNRISQQETKIRAEKIFFSRISGTNIRCRTFPNRRTAKTNTRGNFATSLLISRSIHHASLPRYEL